jgi:YfiH family protein
VQSDLLKPRWSAPDNVVAFTTTRNGGVSGAPYASFNLGDHVGDQAQLVAHNRRRLREDCSLPSEPVWLVQTHSTRVLDLDLDNQVSTDLISDKLPAGKFPSNEADAAITSRAGCVCAVMTADCMPLFLCSRDGSKVAVVHAGWRGIADGIIERAVQKFEQPASSILAWAGPTIGPQHFEIGDDVRQQLAGPDGAYTRSIKSSNNGKWLADLYVLAGFRLAQLGVIEFGYDGSCTYADQQQFFSYRRDNLTGRMASIIYLKT